MESESHHTNNKCEKSFKKSKELEEDKNNVGLPPIWIHARIMHNRANFLEITLPSKI